MKGFQEKIYNFIYHIMSFCVAITPNAKPEEGKQMQFIQLQFMYMYLFISILEITDVSPPIKCIK